MSLNEILDVGYSYENIFYKYQDLIIIAILTRLVALQLKLILIATKFSKFAQSSRAG